MSQTPLNTNKWEEKIMTENYRGHIVMKCKGSNDDVFYVNLYKEEVLDLLNGKSLYDDDFIEYFNEERFKRMEDSINFFCTYKENFISIRRVIEFYRDTAPLAIEPKGHIIKYTRTYDAAIILLELGIKVHVLKESVSAERFLPSIRILPIC